MFDALGSEAVAGRRPIWNAPAEASRHEAAQGGHDGRWLPRAPDDIGQSRTPSRRTPRKRRFWTQR